MWFHLGFYLFDYIIYHEVSSYLSELYQISLLINFKLKLLELIIDLINLAHWDSEKIWALFLVPLSIVIFKNRVLFCLDNDLALVYFFLEFEQGKGRKFFLSISLEPVHCYLSHKYILETNWLTHNITERRCEELENRRLSQSSFLPRSLNRKPGRS